MSEIMVRKPYTADFKAEAVKRVLEQGYCCRQGVLFLACVMDLCSRKIVGWPIPCGRSCASRP